MSDETKKYEEEKQKIVEEISAMDKEHNEARNQKFTRIVEIQGIIKYLKEKEGK